jgi:hypothetical protein
VRAYNCVYSNVQYNCVGIFKFLDILYKHNFRSKSYACGWPLRTRQIFLLLCLYILIVCVLCYVHSVFIVPTGILRLPWLRFFHAFSSVLRQMPGYNSQSQGTVRNFPNEWIVFFYILVVPIVLFYVWFVCKCLLYCCHRLSNQLKVKNISYEICLHQKPTNATDKVSWSRVVTRTSPKNTGRLVDVDTKFYSGSILYVGP